MEAMMAEQNAGTAILVIDDEPGIRAGCRRVLEPQGYRVAVAASLHDGWQLFEDGRYAIVLLDVMMPDGRGTELLGPILERDPDVVPIIITGYATVELAVEAIRHGAYDFISKPFSGDVLLLAINRALEKRALSLETRRLQAIEAEAKEREQAQAEAERLLQFKSVFAYTVAHELRAPVAAAQSLLRVLLRGLAGELNEEQQELLGRLSSRLDSLLALVNDLLHLAASKTVQEETPLQALCVTDTLEAVLRRLAPEAAEKELELTLEAPEEAVLATATEEGLERIFANIIGNAIKYTPERGKVAVTVAQKEAEAAVAIADSGIGIPETALAQLGEEFFRAPNAKRTGVSGTGLGLSIVRQHLEHCGGEMEIESEEGVGTTVTVRLRRAVAEHGWEKANGDLQAASEG
jgi:two-component system, sensor histidine kinase and response regulator